MSRIPSAHPLRLLREDITESLEADRTNGGRASLPTAVGKALLTTRLQAVILLRLAQAAHRFFPPLAAVLKYINSVLTGADIAQAAAIGPGLRLFHPVGVVIGPDCRIGARCTIMQGATLGAGAGGSPTLGEDVFVGAGARIYGRLTVGHRCMIGANAVVLGGIPCDSFAAGIPAEVIKRIHDPHHVRQVH
jgi:serine O-acetyltransferase